MRDLILDHEIYTEAQRRDIGRYNRSDVDATIALLPALLSTLDLPRALHRGRFMGAVARQEWLGLPLDTVYLDRLLANWEWLQRHYITQNDEYGLYDDISFCEQRMWDLIEIKRWDWPRTPTGKFELKNKTLGRQAKRYPELQRLVRLRENIAELRISKLANTVGRDGFSRCPLLPFWTRTGRNQPSAEDKFFLPSLTAWLRGLLRPSPGWALVELDWDAQEIGIMAGLSNDPAMMADYRTGDPYWAFGVRAGLVSPDVNKAEHQEFRNKILKPVMLGQNYGMTPYGIAAQTGRSLLWARDTYARHRRTYSTFHRWRDDVVAQAKFDRAIASPFGWPMAVIGTTKHRTLMNFVAQAGGADAMRIAAIAATEAKIAVCYSVHDAFWIMAPHSELAGTIEAMRDIMVQAGTAVSGGLPITASIAATVTSNQNLADTRKAGDKGYDMWAEVRDLLNGGLQRQGDRR
jgi:DNA polymerase I